jgi:hypothetical protein
MGTSRGTKCKINDPVTGRMKELKREEEYNKSSKNKKRISTLTMKKKPMIKAKMTKAAPIIPVKKGESKEGLRRKVPPRATGSKRKSLQPRSRANKS